MDTVTNHFDQWGAVAFFIILYSVVFLFLPFYKKTQRKPASAYFAFVLAFAIEMHGIPFSMYIISAIIGKSLPDGILWGHTLIGKFGHLGLYLNIALALAGFLMIFLGWRDIYHHYWKKVDGQGKVCKKGIYSLIRHPQYTGLLLISLGMLFGWATLPTLIMFPVIVWLYVRLAKREETDMLDEFGEEYSVYMKKTKRFIPYLI